MPRPDDIALVLATLPADMIRSHAEAVASERGLTAVDLTYILAGYELSKPRVVKTVMSDSVPVTEAVG